MNGKKVHITQSNLYLKQLLSNFIDIPHRNEGKILKFLSNHKRYKIASVMLRENRGLVLPGFKLYYKATIIKRERSAL